MNRKTALPAFLLLLFVTAAVGFVKPEGDPVYQIITRLNNWAANNPVEKVYLQLDKPYYSAGDDIWFKAYVTAGPQHKLSLISGVLDVELIDELDSVKQHIKLPVVNGLTRGDLALSDTVAEGNYRIRAYTNYMRNAGSDYFFDQHITVINRVNSKVFTNTTYRFSTENGQQAVKAVINYTNADGAAYAGKQVKYIINLNAAKPIQGRGVTDEKGNLTVNFFNVSPAPVNTGNITTTIITGRDNAVTNTIPIKATSANIDVQFFPESGNLVNGINSRVAFKAVSADGLGADIKGEIVDDKNNVVTSFASQHLGMGIFNLDPKNDVGYKAAVTFADGSVKTLDLPKALDKGHVLRINSDDPDSIHIAINTSRNLVANADDTLYLVAQSGGQVYYAAKNRPGIAKFTATLAKSRFPSGIVQFTLFSSKNEPLNERLVFIQNPDQLKLNISTGEQTTATRQKVKLTLNAADAAGKPVNGSFSVSVVDELKVPDNEDNESSIMANLLLTSDLKGYVEMPNYYFGNIIEKTRADLDVLMLTQGYRRFEWKEILSGNTPPLMFAPEKNLKVSGRVTTNNGKPIVHGKVSLVSTTHGFFYIDTVTDEQGRFSFNNLQFGDSIRFALQARTEKDRKNVHIDVDNINPGQIPGDKTSPDIKVNVSDSLSAYMRSSKEFYKQKLKYGLANHSTVLKEVVIKSTRPVVKYSENLNGPGQADQVITSDQFDMCSDIITCLQGKLFFITFHGNVPYSRNAPMTINLDGVFITPDEFSEIETADIQSVEVLRTIEFSSIYGSQAGPGGVLLLTTKRGDDFKRILYKQAVPGIVAFSPIGYYKVRQFYSPQYGDPKTNTTVADLRSTIYWNPDVVTGKNGTASVEFYNAGSKGTNRVTIEGIDVDGNLGRQIYRYKVE